MSPGRCNLKKTSAEQRLELLCVLKAQSPNSKGAISVLMVRSVHPGGDGGHHGRFVQSPEQPLHGCCPQPHFLQAVVAAGATIHRQCLRPSKDLVTILKELIPLGLPAAPVRFAFVGLSWKIFILKLLFSI